LEQLTEKVKVLKLAYRKIVRTTLLTLLVTSSIHSVAGNNQYRWVNSRGNPVYSDRPPPKGVDYEVVSAGSSLKRVVSAGEGAVPLEIEPRVGNEFDQVDTAGAKRARKNPELCQRARKNLEALTSSPKVKVRNDQGEVRFLTPEEMEVQRQTARAQISVYCE
jgi:hypothetical protein